MKDTAKTSNSVKDTIYVDVDDEITSIIDKVASSKHKIVALVLPKRASMLQSIVNMKLLKRSGDIHKKKLVLITSESSILPLAGAVKLHTAKTLQSKPNIPCVPNVPTGSIAIKESDIEPEDEVDSSLLTDIENDEVSDEPLDKERTVGELATAKKVSQGPGAFSLPDEESIDIDDPDDDKNIATADEDGAKTKKSKIASNKKIKIPNFEKFRLKLLLGGGALIVILIATYVANFVLPKAKIIVSTDDISVNTNISFTANVNVSNLDVDKAIAPAVSSEVSKTDTEKVTATGKKNVGEKAVGTVSLELSDCSSKKVTVPSGTTVTDNDLSFVTQKEITFYSVPVGDDCLNSDLPAYSTGTVKVVAKEPGDQYNINGGRKFRVEGFTGVKGTDSSAMTGGTTKEITIVSDQDIETAKQKLADKSKETANSELAKKLKEQNLIPIIETFTAGAPSVSASPEVGSESADTTVTSVVSYKMLGVKREYIKTLVTNNAKTQIDVSKQSIQNDGIDKAVYRVTNKSSADIQVISLQAVVSTGTEVDEEALKKELVGKKKGEIQQLIGNRPGVKEVDVQYSPFWVYKTPKNPNKIHFEFKQIGNASD